VDVRVHQVAVAYPGKVCHKPLLHYISKHNGKNVFKTQSLNKNNKTAFKLVPKYACESTQNKLDKHSLHSLQQQQQQQREQVVCPNMCYIQDGHMDPKRDYTFFYILDT